MPDELMEPASLRLPSSLMSTIRSRAAANRRSLNSEMIVILEKALPENEKADAAATASA